jgi:hypothetical protein
MDWDTANLIDGSSPEFEMLNYYTNNAWFVECQACVEHWKQDAGDYKFVQKQKTFIDQEYNKILKASAAVREAASGVESRGVETGTGTPVTISEAETPAEEMMPLSKKQKTSVGNLTPISGTTLVS